MIPLYTPLLQSTYYLLSSLWDRAPKLYRSLTHRTDNKTVAGKVPFNIKALSQFLLGLSARLHMHTQATTSIIEIDSVRLAPLYPAMGIWLMYITYMYM